MMVHTSSHTSHVAYGGRKDVHYTYSIPSPEIAICMFCLPIRASLLLGVFPHCLGAETDP
ncbi:hypothetical protein OUZ56_010822 [Daphnia magna]|uniref:Uncharacterized protein n=1 Tax=Daphnia magna TaxID=35525 RepID=A0ABQ9YYM2_9CRUS|nr:hypothetical protein OUZ56_010822 [Daphnia magna]